MHDAAFMRCDQRLCYLECIPSCGFYRDRSLGELLTQCVAFQQFRNDVGSGAVEPDVENRNNIRVIESCSRPSFVLEAVKVIWIIAGGWPDQFDRNISSQALIACAENLSHPS